jgi:hypothetical protein
MTSVRYALSGVVLLSALLLAPVASAETYQLSWDPVTQYTDGSAIESSKTIMYTVYWTTDSTLASGLKTLASSITTSYTNFDPAIVGMTSGTVVYFTAKTVLSTGEESVLSTPYPWTVSKTKPNPPGQMRIKRIK